MYIGFNYVFHLMKKIKYRTPFVSPELYKIELHLKVLTRQHIAMFNVNNH